jgi:hypothetical protein
MAEKGAEFSAPHHIAVSDQQLSVTVESVVTVVKAAATMPITSVGNSQHAVDGADRAADAGADRTAHHCTHRSGRASALSGAFPGAANNALRMPQMWNGE